MICLNQCKEHHTAKVEFPGDQLCIANGECPFSEVLWLSWGNVRTMRTWHVTEVCAPYVQSNVSFLLLWTERIQPCIRREGKGVKTS